MRATLVIALASAALLPAPSAPAATPMKAVIVRLDPLATSPAAVPAREVAGRLERAGRRAQAPLLSLLDGMRRAGHARHVRSLWIANAIAVTADESVLAALRARSDVRSIELDSELPIRPSDVAPAEPGIAASTAPELWSHGIDGGGVTVATLDTGVDLTHPELASRFRGGSNSWFDAYGQHSEPMDVNGHGTQVTGLIVAGNGIGMAPGARFIAARVFNDSGVSTDSGVHLAFQWLLDPDGNPATSDAPNVVNASWGAQLAACDREFEPDLQALRSAHILPVFAAGNDGPAAPSDTSPANLPEAFAVGATATATAIAPFSSIGPSRCDNGAFPSLVAPGTGIRSTDRFGFDANGLAGTSFAAPHVAGALALVLQIAPQLTAEDQARLLTESAHDLGAPGPDTTFGAGSLDVAAAARLLSPTLDFSPPALSGEVYADAALRAHATDTASAVVGAEWWADVDPGAGLGEAVPAADGNLDSPSEDLVASVAALPPGDHVIGLRARDAAGNWSLTSLLAISVPAPPASPLVASSSPAVGSAPSVDVLTAARGPLKRVASDGFEHGLAGWPIRVGAVAAIRAAALRGRRGLRATIDAGARVFVQRRLQHPSGDIELSFDLHPRTLSTGGAWIEIAAIGGADGRRSASVDIRAGDRGNVQLRVSSSDPAGAAVHSKPQLIRRRMVALTLSLDPGHASLVVSGRNRLALMLAAASASGTTITFGLGRPAPSASSGHFDIDRVTVRTAHAAT